MEEQRLRGNENKSTKTFQILSKDKQQIRQIYYAEGNSAAEAGRAPANAFGQSGQSPSKLKSGAQMNQSAQQQAQGPGGLKSRNREIQSSHVNANSNLSGQYKQKQSQSLNMQKPNAKPQVPAGGQFHVVHHNGTNINNILQNPMLQNILSQNSGSKQQIIIVQSGGQTSQAINNLIQSQQSAGGQQPQAISLSGLTMQELNGILNAYGLTDTQGQLSQNSRSISLQPLAQGSHPGQVVSQSHVQAPQTNSMVAQQSNVTQSSPSPLVSQGTGMAGDGANVNLGQQLQQQIEQLQAQNQLMQQQILQNVGIGLGEQAISGSNLGQILQSNQIMNLQQSNAPSNIGMGGLMTNLPQAPDPMQNLSYQLMSHNLNQSTTQQQRQFHQQQQINSLQKQIMQLRNNQQHQGQFYNPNLLNIGNSTSNQIIDQQIQHLQMNQSPWPQASPTQDMPDLMSMTQQQLNSILQSNYHSSSSQKVQHQLEANRGQNEEQASFARPVLQTKQPWGSQISSVIQTQKPRKKKETMAADDANKQPPATNPKKKNITKQDSKTNAEYSSTNDTANKPKSQNQKKMNQQKQQVELPSNQSSRHYQSATYRQNQTEPQSQSNSSTNNYGSKGGAKQMQSPIIAGSRGSVTTQKDQNQQQLIDSSDKLIQKIRNNKKKLKSKQITADILQTPPAKAPNQSRNEAAANNQNENSKRQNQSGSKQKEKDDQILSRNRLQKSNQVSAQIPANNMLNLPPPAPTSPPALTAKEKKRLRLEKEKERQQELFEKNFKRESLYICKMALNVQKSFITKPTAIIVYHQHRLVKLDITQNNLYQQPVPSAVPQLQVPAEPKKPLLITPEQLNDFYLHSRVRKYKLVNRNLEVIEEPNYLFKEDQQNVQPKQHSIQERKIREVLDELLAEKEELAKPEKLAENPIVFPSGNIKDTTIFFNSRFESGNLREVEKVGEMEYNCYVNFDFNSTVHSQWYYFSVRNIAKGKMYKFNIMNLQKDESCYQIGMKPFVYSTKQNREAGTNEWKRGCEQVCYYKNKLQTRARECAPDYEFDEDTIPCYEYDDEASRIVTLNTLSFCYEFEYENDITYFAYFQPYSLSDLEDYLFQIQKNYDKEHLDHIYKCEKLCDTLGKKPCYVLTITDNVQEDDIKIKKEPKADENKEDAKNQGLQQNSARNASIGGSTSIASTNQKKNDSQTENEDNSVLSGFQLAAKNKKDIDENQKQTIFLTGRVHPGESNASFMIQGAIDFLLQKNNKEAKMLREQFIFKIVPMLNPDGVVNGHYRCNYIGADLNRRWPNPSKLLHPTIYYTKKLLKMCHQDNQVLLFCDFHGHTRKRNVFMYGCVSQQSEINQHKNNNLIRIVPYLLDQKNKCFSFNDCKFANEKEKESTGRLVMFKEFGILNSYTIESTFYSCYNPRMGQKKKVNVEDDAQIKIEELYQVGHDFCETLMSIINSKILKRKFITDTTTPLGNFCPGQGGNPISNFFVNQQNELNAQKQHQNNSIMYNQQNNVQSVLKTFINGPSINPYSLIGGPSSIAANSSITATSNALNQANQSPDKKGKQKNMAKSQNTDSIIQQFNSSREVENNQKEEPVEANKTAPESVVPIQQNAQNSTNSSCRKQSVGISGPTLSSQSLYMGFTPNNQQRMAEKDIGQEEIALASFQEQNSLQRPLVFDAKKNLNHSSHNVHSSRKAEDAVSGNTNVHLTQPSIQQSVNGIIHQSNTPQFHHNDNYDHISIENNGLLTNLARTKKHSYQLSSHRFKESLEKQSAIQSETNKQDDERTINLAKDESKTMQSHATNEKLDETDDDKLDNSKVTDSEDKQSKTMIEIQLEASDRSDVNIDDQNLMGPEQMNILDQYINKSSLQSKQNKAASLEQSISIPAQQLTAVEQTKTPIPKQTKQEMFRKAQTFAYQHQQNNLYPLEVGFGGQNLHNTPNSKNTANVLKIKSSEVSAGVGDGLIKINKSRLSAQVASSSKTNHVNAGLLRQTAYQQSNQAGSFFTNNTANQPIKRQSSSSMKPNKTNQNFHNSKTRDMATDDANSEQYNMFGLRDQKQSKSSLAMTSSNFKNGGNAANLKNIIVQNIHTPVKESQKTKQKKYNQTLVNSAGNNMAKPSSLFEQPFVVNTQAQLQNFLPQQSTEQSEITVQLQNKYQALQQRKYAEVLSQQLSKEQILAQQQQARQSYQSNTSNNAEINFKRKYGVTAVASVIDSYQKFQSSQISHEEEIVNNYQNIQPDSSQKTTQGTGVLPKINQDPGSRRITQGYNDVSNLRPSSQNKADTTPQYPHRNILTNMTGQSSIASAASNQQKQYREANGIAYGDQMQFNNYTHQVHDNGSKTNSNRRDQPVSIRMKGKSTKNLSS